LCFASRTNLFSVFKSSFVYIIPTHHESLSSGFSLIKLTFVKDCIVRRVRKYHLSTTLREPV
jgi:hypothetical protein